jgi:hypothetical protein
MRIIIDTEAQHGISVVNPDATTSATATAAINGGSAPASFDGSGTAPSSDSILTIDAGTPSAGLVAAITALSDAKSAQQPIDAGPAPRL